MQADAVAITALRPRLEKLAELLDSVEFSLPTQGRDDAERVRTAVIRTVQEYLIPRLDEPEAPVVAAVIGASGTGKSTIVNSLANDRISDVGPLRPTTRNAVLWAHREHGSRYWSEFVARVRDRVGPTVEVVIGDDELIGDLTIIDTPPAEYVAPSGRRPAVDALALADLCVFVTSPSRYADISAWEFLREIRWRGVPMLFVLNRLPSDRDVAASLLNDFARRLHDNGLLLEPDAAMVFGVDEAVGDRWHGGLDPSAVGALRNELGAVSNTGYRNTLVAMTAYTTGRNLVDRCRVISDEFADIAAISTELDSAVSDAYGNQVAEITRLVADGALSDMARHKTWSEAAVDLTAIVTRRAGVAAQETAGIWMSHETGDALLAGKGTSLWRHTEDTSWDVQGRLEEWQEALAQVVSRNSKKGSLGPRPAARLARKAWRVVVDPATAPPRAVRRRFKHKLDAFIEDAQSSLSAVVAEALEFDASRFRGHLSDPARTAARLERQLAAISSLLEGDQQGQLLESVLDVGESLTGGGDDDA
ncbi:MAG: GTPase domain-containing protein [Acidimicrobiia bacterium]